MVGQFTGNRFHPRPVWIGGAAGEVDATCFQLHGKEQMKSGQAALGPDLHGGEVDRSHHVPLRLQNVSHDPVHWRSGAVSMPWALRMWPMVESQMW